MADNERLGRRGFILATGMAVAGGLAGCAVPSSSGISECPPTPRPSLPERNHLNNFFESLGLTYDGTYFYDQEGNKFVFEGFERQERAEGTCPERIIIELKGEPCETPTATRRVESPTSTHRRDTATSRPPSQTPEIPTNTPVPTDTPEVPTPTPPIPTPAPTNEDIIPTATQES